MASNPVPAVLLLCDDSEHSTIFAEKTFKTLKLPVVMCRELDDMDYALELFETEFILKKIMVLGLDQSSVNLWEDYLTQHHFYNLDIPISWYTLLH